MRTAVLQLNTLRIVCTRRRDGHEKVAKCSDEQFLDAMPWVVRIFL